MICEGCGDRVHSLHNGFCGPCVEDAARDGRFPWDEPATTGDCRTCRQPISTTGIRYEDERGAFCSTECAWK